MFLTAVCLCVCSVSEQVMGLIFIEFGERCNVGRSLRWRRSFSGKSTGSRDSLQWAVGLQQQQQTKAVRAEGRGRSTMSPISCRRSRVRA